MAIPLSALKNWLNDGTLLKEGRYFIVHDLARLEQAADASLLGIGYRMGMGLGTPPGERRG